MKTVKSDNVILDTAWFDSKAEQYFERDDFKRVEAIAGINFRDLLSKEEKILSAVQNKLERLRVQV